MKSPKPVAVDVPAKVPRVAVYLPEELFKRLEQEANQEERSLSQMALMLIREALANRDRVQKDGR